MRGLFQIIAVGLLAVLSQAVGMAADESDILFRDGVRIEVEETEARVGIAKVRLNISVLKIENRRVVGKYRIRVPLLKSKNDDGLIDLGFQQAMPVTFHSGGTLKGDGISTVFQDDPPRTITCEIIPDAVSKTTGVILLTIVTTDREIEFESRYRVYEVGKTGDGKEQGRRAEWL